MGGALANDTNNLVIDCVLTNKGRELLSRNDGSFSVIKFAVGDDEVDYTIIKRYGRTVGLEKIEKNTPVFEALTNENLAQKFRLISLSNPNLVRLPNLSITGEGVDSVNSIVAMGTGTNSNIKTRTLTVTQTIVDETSIDSELLDQMFMIEMSNMFLELSGDSPDVIDAQQRATYMTTRSANTTSTGGSTLQFTIRTKAISESQYQIYGAPSNKSVINTFIKITGMNSGAVLDYQVQITKT